MAKNKTNKQINFLKCVLRRPLTVDIQLYYLILSLSPYIHTHTHMHTLNTKYYLLNTISVVGALYKSLQQSCQVGVIIPILSLKLPVVKQLAQGHSCWIQVCQPPKPIPIFYETLYVYMCQ